MSDAGRQSFTDKTSSAIKPDSQKTTGEVAKEKLDSVASTFQPDSSKSNSQKAGDAVAGNDHSDKSIIDKAKDAVGFGGNTNNM